MANLSTALTGANVQGAVGYNTQSDEHFIIVEKLRGNQLQMVFIVFKFHSGACTLDNNFYTNVPNLGLTSSPAQRIIYNVVDLQTLLALTANGGYTTWFAIPNDGT